MRSECCDREQTEEKLQLIVAEIIVIFVIILIIFSSCTIHSVRIDKPDETIKSPFAVIIDNSVVPLLEQFDGGESLDLDILQLISSGVHLGNDNTV